MGSGLRWPKISLSRITDIMKIAISGLDDAIASAGDIRKVCDKLSGAQCCCCVESMPVSGKSLAITAFLHYNMCQLCHSSRETFFCFIPFMCTAIIDQDSETSIVNPARTFLPQIITIGDLPHTVEVNSESQYFVDDKTLAPSLPAITISSTPISLCPYPTSQTIIGSTNVPRWMPPLH